MHSDRQMNRSISRQLGTRQDLLLWILAIGAVVTYFLDILVDNAVSFHDEYVYKAAADHRLPPAELYAKGAIEYIPNRLYLAVYRIASWSEQNDYAAAQFFNVVFWALGLLAVCRLAQLLGVTGRRLVAFAVLAVLLPFAIYTKYFMPEAMYFCLFACGALLLFKAVASGSHRLMLAAGLLAGLAYYVKPHALIIFGATVLFLLATGGGLAGRWRSVCAYGAGFVLVVIVGTLVIDKPQGLARLGVYDQMVKGMMGTATTILHEPGAHLRAVGTVGIGHVVLLLSSWTIPLALAVSACAGTWRAARTGTDDPAGQEVRLFGTWLMIMVVALVCVVVAFTVLVAEVGRIHSRYYCFLYPFLLLGLFLYEPARHGRGSKLAMSAVALVLGLALLAMPAYSGILGISLVSDSPELGFAFFPRPAAAAAVLLLVAGQLWAVWRSPQPFWLILAVTFACSQYYVRQAQGHIFRGPYTDGRDAAAVEQVLGAERLRAAVVMGDSRDAVSKFLFNLSVVPVVAQRPFDQVGTLVKDYPNADTFLLLTDKVDDIPGLSCEKLGQRVVRCLKK
jgi:phosphoglycerol transferase